MTVGSMLTMLRIAQSLGEPDIIGSCLELAIVATHGKATLQRKNSLEDCAAVCGA